MLKLRHYFFFCLLGAAILTGCSNSEASEKEDNNDEAPAFYSPFRLI